LVPLPQVYCVMSVPPVVPEATTSWHLPLCRAQLYWMTLALSAVDAPATSRQLPLLTLTMRKYPLPASSKI
jgi:hypothetical protein